MTQKAPLPRWIRIALVGTLAVVALAAVGLVWLERSAAGDAGFPRYGAMPGFRLTNQSGQPVTAENVKGKLLAVGFIYTNCPDICPMLTSQMKQLQDDLRTAGLLGSDVLLLSVSVDPERDTPDVLAAYAKQHGADLSSWHFLTGDISHVRDIVTQGFLVGMQKGPPATDHTQHDHGAPSPTPTPPPAPSASAYEVNHSGRIVLVDRTGQIRRYYDSTDFDAAKVIGDIQLLR